jgi:hypothetical protein
MAAVSQKKKKTVLVVLLVIALGIFLPPNINGKRFKQRLATALGDALGHRVKIGSLSYRLLPRPGFDLYDFEVDDDPAFSAEPLLLCGKATADLRLTSLWQGRLEIANLKLQDTSSRVPPSLNLVFLNGHWNVESLLARAEQVPTAPTAKRRAESRTRFPYIEADGGRINIKSGPEKKPYALVDTDFAFWLAAEDVWHFRLQGHPMRTDMHLSDTGTIKVEGDLKRAPEWQQTPVQFQVSWNGGQLGQLSRLALGHDQGWRGTVAAKAEATGTLLNLHISAETDLQDFRRYDINRRGMFALSTRCLGEYSQGLLDFNCSLPLETGGIRLSGKVAPLSPANYDLSLVANRVPLSSLTTFARYAKRTLPDDLSSTGQLDAAFAFHSHDNTPADWHGAGSTSAFVMRSAVASNPIAVSSLHFIISSGESRKVAAKGRKRQGARSDETATTPSLAIEPFSIQIGNGALLQGQGNLGREGYALTVRGTAPLDQILDLGNLAGFHSRIRNTTATVNLDVDMHGQWANFSPARLGGTAHLENVVAAIPGIKRHLLLPTADVHFGDTEAVLVTTAQFDRSPVTLSGSVIDSLNCPPENVCPLQFDLRAESLDAQDIAALVGSGTSGWKLPFLSGPDKPPDIRAGGTLTVAKFTAGGLALEKLIAHLELGDHTLVADQVNARVANGALQGEWRIDWTTFPVRHSGTGTITGVSLERFPLPAPASSILVSWINGKTSVKYFLQFAGSNEKEMLATAQGRAEFTLANGISRVLTLEAAKPTRFQSFQGRCEIKNQVLDLLESKFKADNRIYDVSGTISLASRQTKLKVSNHDTQWEITGEVEKPKVASQRLTALQVPVRPQ